MTMTRPGTKFVADLGKGVGYNLTPPDDKGRILVKQAGKLIGYLTAGIFVRIVK